MNFNQFTLCHQSRKINYQKHHIHCQNLYEKYATLKRNKAPHIRLFINYYIIEPKIHSSP